MEGKAFRPATSTRPTGTSKSSQKIYRRQPDSSDDDWEYSRSDEYHELEEFSNSDGFREKLSSEQGSTDSENYSNLGISCCQNRAERVRKGQSNYGWKDDTLKEPFHKPVDDTALLCNACRTFFTTSDRTSAYKHYHDLSSLRTAAKRGCQFCTLIRTMVDAPHLEAKPSKDIHIRLELPTYNTPTLLKVPDIGIEYQLEGGTLEDQRALLLPLNLIRPRGIEHRITSTSGSAENAILSRKWLDSCCRNHPKCKEERILSGKSWVPSRLLHINHPKPGMVRLEHAFEIPAKARYLALSHCWGTTPTTPTTMLLSDKYERARGGVPIYALPKTYRDAISIVKWFDAEYIWIDSLCIIQDSEEDWLKESVTMKDVYKNSLCTIAATAATNSSEGCFFRREIDFTRWAPMRVGWTSIAEGEYHCVYPNLWNDNVSDAPLNKRAWVLQERWLSPRVLHFARDQIYWECQELSACERYPSGVSAEILHLLEDQQLKRSTAPKVGTWMKIAEDYSHRLLTRNSDKLVALSGIAMELCQRTRQEYICGLWKPHIEAQLCWRVKTELASSTPVTRSREYRAPSWSWLSIDGDISFPYKPGADLNDSNSSDSNDDEGGKDYKSLITIEDVLIQPPNDFTKTTSANLTLRGFLQPVKWRGAHSLHQAGQVFIEGKMTKHIDLVFDDVTATAGAGGGSSSPHPASVFLLPLILVAKDLTYGLVVTEPKDRGPTTAATDQHQHQHAHAHGAAVRTLARVGWFEARSSLSTLRRLRANLARQDRGRASSAAKHDLRSVIRLV